MLKILWPIGEPVRLIGIRFMHLRARGNAFRSAYNKSDIIELSDGAPCLPMPEEIVPLRVSNSDEAASSSNRESG
jgi:hypothetical protein